MLVLMLQRVSSRVSGLPLALPCLWGKLQHIFEGFKAGCNVFLRSTLGTVPDIVACLQACRESFCVTGKTPHFTLHTLHSTLYTPHSALYTPHSALHTLHSTLHSTLLTLHSTLYTPHSTLCTLHSTLYTPHSTLHTPHTTLHTLHSTLTHCTPHTSLYTLHSTLHTPHFTLYTLDSTLYTLHSTLYTIHSTLYTVHSKRRRSIAPATQNDFRRVTKHVGMSQSATPAMRKEATPCWLPPKVTRLQNLP